ncbi:YveK family protein [Pseudonocardia phyllosphaerae]|uniref:hypothetical protein n=1 Tax=Pseudonocardia phyllosphaerae TaxID=3390502 RepID=UPI00397A08E8
MLSSTRRWPVMTVRRAAVLMGTLFLVGLLAGLVVDQLRPASWKAGTDVLVRTWSTDSLLLTGQPAELTTADQADAATVAVSEPVLTRAAATLGAGMDWHELTTTVTAEPVPSSHLVRITATGTDERTAAARADAVAAAFADLRKEQLDAAAAGLVRTPAGATSADVRLRSQLLIGATRPLEVFRTAVPEQTSPGVTLPASAAIVGLGVGALVVLALTTLRPALGTGRDAQRAGALPGVDFDPARSGVDAGEELARMLGTLVDDGRRGALHVMPIVPAADKDASAVVEWVHERGYGSAAPVLLPEPTAAVLRPRPLSNAVLALALVVPAGTSREQLRDALRLLRPWRAADVVVVTA